LEPEIDARRPSPIEAIQELIDRLRGKNGCPWDRKQTPRSLAVYLIEEVYELVDAIETQDRQKILEELGDVLFQVFFVLHLFQEKGDFDLGQVVRANVSKMIRRHPHVFGDETIESAEMVKDRWHQIKLQEQQATADPVSVLDSVPQGMPALMRAYRISERAARTGFDWQDIGGVMQKAQEEWFEFAEEVKTGETSETARQKAALEFGDILFTLVNVARFARIHPETALIASILKFENRFKYMETEALRSGRSLDAVAREEMDALWEKAKNSS
jgi:tetrapyrrole methylase family protein/MazG family protein